MENVPGLGQTNGARTVVDGVIEPPQTITLWMLSQAMQKEETQLLSINHNLNL